MGWGSALKMCTFCIVSLKLGFFTITVCVLWSIFRMLAVSSVFQIFSQAYYGVTFKISELIYTYYKCSLKYSNM